MSKYEFVPFAPTFQAGKYLKSTLALPEARSRSISRTLLTVLYCDLPKQDS